MPEPEAFAVLKPEPGLTAGQFIVTARKDGTIPLDSIVVAKLVDGTVGPELLAELIRRANRE